jgi:hypothetical protein
MRTKKLVGNGQINMSESGCQAVNEDVNEGPAA